MQILIRRAAASLLIANVITMGAACFSWSLLPAIPGNFLGSLGVSRLTAAPYARETA